MGIDLPTGQRVFALVLLNRLVGISAGGIGRQLAKKQYIFRASDSHLGTILAHLGIAQTVGLIVFPHHVSIDRNASHISEAMLHVMKYSHFAERVNSWHTVPRGVAEQNTIFHMDAGQPTRFQNAH